MIGRVTKQWYVNNKSIAYLRYRPNTGQVGIIWVDKDYQRRGLGRAMLDVVIQDTVSAGQSDKVWAISLSDHSFWKNVWGGSFHFNGSGDRHIDCGVFTYTLKDCTPWQSETWLSLASPFE